MNAWFDCSKDDERAEGLTAAAAAVLKGELVVLPADTVYGVGADAFSPAAVARLMALKNQPRNSPPAVLVGSTRAASALVEDLGPYGQQLIDEFWPGGLTIVCRAARTLNWDLGDTRGTVSVRMPEDPVTLDLLKETGPMAVTSANVPGEPPATTASGALAQFGNDVAVYLDGGPSADGMASTIVDLTGDVPRLLRQGAISMGRLREIVGVQAAASADP
jgi:L-threonylcarbamoyladenylate synthase